MDYTLFFFYFFYKTLCFRKFLFLNLYHENIFITHQSLHIYQPIFNGLHSFFFYFFPLLFFLETHTHTTDANVSIERVGTMKTEMELLAEIISTRHMLPSNTMKYVVLDGKALDVW